MILVSDWSEDEEYFLGAGFSHVGVKGDYYRNWSSNGKTLGSRMETTAGNVFIDYSEKRWKQLKSVTEAAEMIRLHYAHVLVFGTSAAFDRRVRKLAQDIRDAFKKLPKKQRETRF